MSNDDPVPQTSKEESPVVFNLRQIAGSDIARWDIRNHIVAAADEIERLARELEASHQAEANAFRNRDSACAEIERLRAALDELMRLAGVQTRHSTHYEGCADDHAWCKAFCIVQGALSNNALSERSQSPSETATEPAWVYCPECGVGSLRKDWMDRPPSKAGEKS